MFFRVRYQLLLFSCLLAWVLVSCNAENRCLTLNVDDRKTVFNIREGYYNRTDKTCNDREVYQNHNPTMDRTIYIYFFIIGGARGWGMSEKLCVNDAHAKVFYGRKVTNENPLGEWETTENHTEKFTGRMRVTCYKEEQSNKAGQIALAGFIIGVIVAGTTGILIAVKRRKPPRTCVHII